MIVLFTTTSANNTYESAGNNIEGDSIDHETRALIKPKVNILKTDLSCNRRQRYWSKSDEPSSGTASMTSLRRSIESATP